jgi:DNA-binding NarL/FixJ family response regulator
MYQADHEAVDKRANGSGQEERIRVIIVDDHKLMRRIMHEVLRRDDHIEVVGSASDGEEALQLIQNANSDVVLMDLALPEMDGVEVLKRIREQSIKTPVIIVSVHSQTHAVTRALQEGAQGYVPKTSMTRELVPAIWAVCGGQTYVSKSISQFRA